jgi:hypothetical protein
LAFKDRRPGWLSSVVVVGFVLLLGIPEIPDTFKGLVDMHRDGNGYTGRAWMQSPVIEALKELPADTQIITDQPDAVLFLTGRPAHWIPEIVAHEPVRDFLRFGDGGTYQEDIFRDRESALVLFHGFYQQMQAVYFGQTDSRIASMLNGLTAFRQFDGFSGIYYYPIK